MIKKLSISIIFLLICFISQAQNDTLEETYPSGGSPESPDPEIFILTKRNCPIISNDPKIIFCRKLQEKWQIFGTPDKPMETTTDKPYEQLNNEEKGYIIYLAWHTSNVNLFKKVIQIAKFDTIMNNRLQSIKCLSQFNAPESKELLAKLLKEPGLIGMASALSLVQLGDNNIGLDYIKHNYPKPSVRYLFSEINTALMDIGNDEAIQVLEVAANDSIPSIALDAVGALSLLGKCDYAFNKFKEFSKHENDRIRADAAYCLAFYIGKPKAMIIVEQMQYDKDWSVSEEAIKILKHYHLIKN